MRAPGTIVSTNTSGIPLAQISEGFSDEFRQHFLGTHFFNPPRYLHLVEVIPGAETRPEVLECVSHFCDLRLGKGVVRCKDTPNFIANRIGVLLRRDHPQVHRRGRLHRRGSGRAHRAADRPAEERQLPPDRHHRAGYLGARRCAISTSSCRTIPWRERFIVPEFMQTHDGARLARRKARSGLLQACRQAQKEIHALDLKTLEYHPAQKPRFPSVEAARNIEDLPQRLRALVGRRGSRRERFSGRCSATMLLYSARWFPRFRIASSRSIAPCAGDIATS